MDWMDAFGMEMEMREEALEILLGRNRVIWDFFGVAKEKRGRRDGDGGQAGEKLNKTGQIELADIVGRE
jgi:hypothetical protein